VTSVRRMEGTGEALLASDAMESVGDGAGHAAKPAGRRPPVPALLAAFALSGAAALAYEVVWTRALSIVLGSTTYALSSMLATFMLGLAIGGLVGGRLADRPGEPLLKLGLCEVGIGLGGLASLLLIGLVPSAFLAAYRAFHLESAAFYALQILLCSMVMLGPTLLMGMTFPLAVKALGGAAEHVGATVGKVYGFNTLGSVAGSLLTGFFVVPGLGLRGATYVAASANIVVGLGLLGWSGGRGRRLGAGALLASAAMAAGTGRI